MYSFHSFWESRISRNALPTLKLVNVVSRRNGYLLPGLDLFVTPFWVDFDITFHFDYSDLYSDFVSDNLSTIAKQDTYPGRRLPANFPPHTPPRP